jgi:hypothetical protein
MIRKRILLAAVLAAGLIGSLVGCEQKQKPTAPQAPPNTTDTP